MALTCAKCRRVNPPDAVYCYFDGVVLGGPGRNGGPVSVSTRPFHSPFVFPSGRQCRNFDELALACHEEWAAACSLLQQGVLPGFLAGAGRADLAQAAREAARFPDKDRGLDQLLGKLPTNVLDPPRLRAEPLEVSLGVLQPGKDRQFQLRLHNQGMRLLVGSVSSDDCPWLMLGDSPGAPEKHFQLDHQAAVTVQVRGKQLRAGPKPLEGKLLIETNGGNATVIVRAEVPVKPFPDGVLAGASTPRKVAEKAKAAPKEAAAYFENGAVARWYEANGWQYPVQGPSASGLGAVQQFFEALGLTPPPKVDISERSVGLRGRVGQQLRHVLKVESQEKRPVYAHGKSDQPWLEVGRPQLNGRVAAIALNIPAVPNKPGQTLTAKVVVQANGNQRFVVPVTLAVEGAPAQAFAFDEPAPEPVVHAVPVAPPAPPPAVITSAYGGRPGGLGILHVLPALLLLAVLAGLVGWDAFSGEHVPDAEPDKIDLSGELAFLPVTDLIDTEPRIGVEFSDEKERFGIQLLKESDPGNAAKHKRLTFEERGDSNNTCILIDGKECLFGQKPGEWGRDKKKHLLKRVKDSDRDRFQAVWRFPEDVFCTQTVEIVAGEQTRVLDTVLVHYTLENRSTVPHTVGLRVMIDTFIGGNDGVPFTIPGQPGLLDTKQDFPEKDIPQYIQALEFPDLEKPGTVAHMGLKGFRLPGVQLDPIEKLRICRWPGSEARWDWPPLAINDNSDGGRDKDSCVVLFWNARKLNPKERRDMAFTYGLNKISTTGKFGSKLGLTAGGDFRVGGEFTLTAYLRNPEPGQKVTLEALPAGVALAEGQKAEQAPAVRGDYTQVSWRLRGQKAGEFALEVTSGPLRESYTVRIRDSSLFRGK